LSDGNQLITFGIVPDAPETCYGYIRAGKPISGSNAAGVDEFVEKPDAARAAEFVDAGGYYWNSGMFMFKARTYLAELNRFRPDIHQACERAASEEVPDLDFSRPGKCFADCPSESIDYAVMEHTDKSVVLPVDFGWSDVGSWHALWATGEKDPDGNDFHGDVISVDTRGTYIHADKRLVAAVGVDDLVVVETADAVLVARRDADQAIKQVVANIKDRMRPEHHTHTRVFRPWGSYETVEAGPRYQVKRITVSPGASLSLQMHHHRSEHWIVVRGTATVHRDGVESTLTENESTYIPLGAKHRLSNPGRLPLELIEVQVGPYLGEDDIVRFEDAYGRTPD
jgi:mannose-1-phosphate guanylyltransferase/mannose-6-phosphate isomerase